MKLNKFAIMVGILLSTVTLTAFAEAQLCFTVANDTSTEFRLHAFYGKSLGFKQPIAEIPAHRKEIKVCAEQNSSIKDQESGVLQFTFIPKNGTRADAPIYEAKITPHEEAPTEKFLTAIQPGNPHFQLDGRELTISRAD